MMAAPRISIIAALARNRVIGNNNQLPWRLPEDLQHFKRTTLGCPILMGRKTWESLGRPLPGRLNVVISRNRHYETGASDVRVVESLEAAVAACGDAPQIFIIGGAELYQQALNIADQLILTEIDADFAGDAYFPEADKGGWLEAAREAHVSANGLAYAFVNYLRRP